MKKYLFLGVCSLLSLSFVNGAETAPLLFGDTSPKAIALNNRVLAKVGDKAISVLDLTKKMDLLFYKQYPQYSAYPEARFQFYEMSWKSVLQQMIDKELILADAEELKMITNSGDVRQEMEETFGPSIIANLDKAGLSYEEAWQMIKDELILRRMLFFRVNSKALKSVTPQDIRAAYREHAKEHSTAETWHYQVVSIRGKEMEKTKEAAAIAHRLLQEEHVSLEQLASVMREKQIIDESVTVSVSEENSHVEKDLSTPYKQALVSLENGSFSSPLNQKSRNKDEALFRIFYLRELAPAKAPAFNEVETSLKEKLIGKMIATDTEAYLKKLRKNHHVEELLLQDLSTGEFRPFVLQ